MIKKFKYSFFISIFFITHTYANPLLMECDNLQRSNLLFTEKFEQKIIEKNWIFEVCSSCPYAVNKSRSHARSGLHSARFELRKNDPDAISGRKRTELTQIKTEPNGNRQRWYAVSIYLPLYYTSDPVAEIVTQWHAIPDKSSSGQRLEEWRSPPLALLTVDGEWQVDLRWDEKKITTTPPKSKHHRLGSYTLGKWTDWVFHVHWSYEGNGNVTIWKDGTEVFSYIGPIGYNDDKGTYMKVGIYKWAWGSQKLTSLTEKRILYIDSIYIGDENATYCDVASRRL